MFFKIWYATSRGFMALVLLGLIMTTLMAISSALKDSKLFSIFSVVVLFYGTYFVAKLKYNEANGTPLQFKNKYIKALIKTFDYTNKDVTSENTPQQKSSSIIKITAIIGIVWLFFIAVYDRQIPSEETHEQNTTNTKHYSKAELLQMKTKAEANKTNGVPTQKASIEEIKKRYQDNKEFLKKYYADNNMINQINQDMIVVVSEKITAKINNDTKKFREISEFYKKLSMQARKAYASTLEHKMMDEGQEISFSTQGSNAETLSVEWALMGKAAAYSIHQNIADAAKSHGFKKIIYRDVFDNYYSYTLE